MPVPKHVFVTGATGFVGSHLTNRLLKDGHRVTALARGSRTSDARDRILEVLSLVSESDFRNNAALERLTVLEGDISQPNLGVDHNILRKAVLSIDETWHCAASLSFAEEERNEIFRMNVGGARNVIEVVKQTPGKRGATHLTALAAPAVSFVGMIRSGSKGRAVERTAISVLRGGHPYERRD